jgi:hypothetical protein
MIMIYTMTYPTISAVEFGKAAVKNFQENPWPAFIKLIGPYSLVCESGCKSYAILEIESGKEDEAFKIITKRLANYISVPGFGWKEERLLTMAESFVLLGLEGP